MMQQQFPRPATEDALLKKIIAEEIEGIKTSKERVFVECNGKIHLLNTYGDDEYPVTYLTNANVKKMCGVSNANIFHTHNISSGIPSSTDMQTYGMMFKEIPLAKKACSVGLDGWLCIDSNGKKSSRKFSVDDQEIILKSTGMKKWKGDSLFCDKVVNEPNEKFLCTLEGIKKSSIMGIFGEVTMVGGTTWAGDPDADISMFSPNVRSDIECFGSPHGKKKLACILKDSITRNAAIRS